MNCFTWSKLLPYICKTFSTFLPRVSNSFNESLTKNLDIKLVLKESKLTAISCSCDK